MKKAKRTMRKAVRSMSQYMKKRKSKKPIKKKKATKKRRYISTGATSTKDLGSKPTIHRNRRSTANIPAKRLQDWNDPVEESRTKKAKAKPKKTKAKPKKTKPKKTKAKEKRPIVLSPPTPTWIPPGMLPNQDQSKKESAEAMRQSMRHEVTMDPGAALQGVPRGAEFSGREGSQDLRGSRNELLLAKGEFPIASSDEEPVNS